MSAGEGEWIDPAEAGCRLLIRASWTTLEALPVPVREALFAHPALAGVVLRAASDDPAAMRALRARLHRASAALLLADVAPAAVRAADGIEVMETAEVREARRVLGPGFIVGARCGLSRHRAMVAGELGADYVVFEARGQGDPGRLRDLVSWWAELFHPPVAVRWPGEPEQARQLASAGADFLVLGRELWAEPQAAVVRFDRVAKAAAWGHSERFRR